MTRVIAILTGGEVFIVTHLEEDAGDAYEAWLEETERRDADCVWSALQGDAPQIHVQQLGAIE